MANLLKVLLTVFTAAGFCHLAEAKTKPKPKPKHPKKIVYKGRLVRGEWQNEWDPTLDQSLSSSILINHHEKQIEVLCPGYDGNDIKRKLFWEQLMIALSWRESLHGPRNYVKFKGGVNDGLFQINPRLRPAYGCDGADLFSPVDNIKCAVKMAAQLVDRFGSFLAGPKGGMAAYWQPLRATNSLNRRNREFILATTKTACSTGKLSYISAGSSVAPEDAWWMQAEPVVNTLDDLGLDESQLEPPDEAERLTPELGFADH